MHHLWSCTCMSVSLTLSSFSREHFPEKFFTVVSLGFSLFWFFSDERRIEFYGLVFSLTLPTFNQRKKWSFCSLLMYQPVTYGLSQACWKPTGYKQSQAGVSGKPKDTWKCSGVCGNNLTVSTELDFIRIWIRNMVVMISIQKESNWWPISCRC